MPLNVQLVNAQVKDPQSGQMTPAGLIGSDALSTINQAKNQAIAAVQQKGEETLQSIPDDYTALSNEVDDVKTQLNREKTATPGYILTATNEGNGTEWSPVGLPTDEQTAEAVSNWLDEHPEATTTVQDASLTEVKFTDALKLKTIKDYVTPQMYGAVGNGIADDTMAIQTMFNENYSMCMIVFPKGTYKVTDTLTIPGNANRVLYYFDGGRIKCAHNNDGIYYEQSNSELGHCKFVNLSISGPNPSFGAMSEKTSLGAGVRIIGGYHNVFDKCSISGFKWGVVINVGIANTFTNDTYIRFNEYGVYIVGNATNMNRFLGCSIRQNWKIGVFIDGTGATDLPMMNLFDDCLIESNIPYSSEDYNEDNGIGIYLIRTTSNIFSNCYFENHRRSVFLDTNSSGNKFVFDRYVNNKGALFEFAGISIINNVFLYNIHDSYTATDSIVISTDYASLTLNYFEYCTGLVLGNMELHTNFPKIRNCILNTSFFGNYFDKLNIGTLYQNPAIVESSSSPHIYDGVLYTEGRGYIQFGNQITTDIEITKIDGLQKGDILVLENYQTDHKVQLTNGTYLKLKNGTNCVLSKNNDTIVLYKNYLGQIVEISRSFTKGQISVSKTENVSTHGSSAYGVDNIIKVSVDVTMSSASAGWVDILTLSTQKLVNSGYFSLVNVSNGKGIVGQAYSNNGVLTLRVNGCEAAQYRGECVFFVE